jgi:hypothetical protein
MQRSNLILPLVGVVLTAAAAHAVDPAQHPAATANEPMTGHWEYLAAEIIYENSASADKSIAFIEGATHVFTTCKPCEKTPGQFGDTLKTTYDYVDGWLSKPGRFTETTAPPARRARGR